MKIVNQLENNSVHHHELNQSHVGAFVLLWPFLAVENFDKCVHHDFDLDVG